MLYSEFINVYERLASTTKRLEKITILAEFIKKLDKNKEVDKIYLLEGKVLAEYDTREFGISRQLAIKAISTAFGIKEEVVSERFNKIGDLGEIAEEFVSKRKQSSLFVKKLDVDKVFDNLKKVIDTDGKGSVDKKMALISELLGSASGLEAKYIIRTLLNDLRIGVAEGVIKEAIAEAFFDDKTEVIGKIEEIFDMVGDLAVVVNAASKGKSGIDDIKIVPGRPMKVMLAVKAESIEEGFEVCGKPCAIEHKYDGFRVLINKNEGKIKLFTRKLEEVTKQFPDVVEYVTKNVKGDSFILDSEFVGYDSNSGKYKPFEAISQRIKRKYDIEKIIEKLPVEVDVFDVLYYNGKNLFNLPFIERRKIVEKIIKTEKWKIKPSTQIITDDEKEAFDFYQNALKIGEEGIMMKSLNANYKQGRRVGYMVKIKPEVKDLDLVIVGAEYGTGKRAGWLTSYIVACRDEDEFLEVGKVSSGLKEKEEEGTTYSQMTELIKPLIVGKEGNYVKVKPKVIVSVTYQNIQISPSYDSGYALRFPRITRYRPDKGINDINSILDIKREAVGK